MPRLADQLRQFVQENGFNHNDRLPPERALCLQFGVMRGELRKALAELESDGLIWRHVGRGTFIGARPVLNPTPSTSQAMTGLASAAR